MRVPLAVLLLGVLAAPLGSGQDQGVPLTSGMVIERSVRILPGVYRLASESFERPAVVIRGAGIIVDMTGVTIEGGPPFADPDTYTGTGVQIDGAGVTLRGAAIRGYKVAVLARRSPKLHLTRLDLSYNWKPRLLSGYEQEHQADWLSFHDNEKEEWLRYGAAIYLLETDDAEIDHVRAVQGMNGLMVTRSARLRIWNNTFSYLSGVGIGLYRTTDSRIMHNKVDWCVRGYSHGFYYRGQDSTGILMYEQSSRNVVAYNSFTHGGDGVFLWAGQSTMDTGQGGSNDNLFYDNDVSHAVANGIEATFSRNTIVRNRIEDCWHGIWGGYSYDSLILENTFAGNDEGIAIEHGQNIRIIGNTFTGDGTAIRLWANEQQDPNWGYPKFRDTRSHDYRIEENRFDRVMTGMNLTRTTRVRVGSNSMSGVERREVWGAEMDYPIVIDRLAGASATAEAAGPVPQPFPAGMNAMLLSNARRGRATIIVDEWGPYDYLSPKLWPAGRLDARPLRLRVLGPKGQWTLASIRGATAAAKTGVVPGELVLTPADPALDFRVELDYVGERVVTPRGEVIPAGTSFRFSYELFEPAIEWTVRFWKFDGASDPLKQPKGFAALLTTPPARTEQLTRLAYANARAFGPDYSAQTAVTATGAVTLPPGPYDLVVTSDDGIRVWLDGKLVLEDWTIHGPKDDRVPIAGGSHQLRLEYFQNTGAAALQVRIVKR